MKYSIVSPSSTLVRVRDSKRSDRSTQAPERYPRPIPQATDVKAPENSLDAVAVVRPRQHTLDEARKLWSVACADEP